MSQFAEELFHAAREMSPEKREGYLQGACGNDVALRSKVEALLAADAKAGAFLTNTGAGEPDATVPESGDVSMPSRHAPLTEEPGQMIDRYKLLQIIGEGGFGTVWMAEQEHPVRRKVALKIIKLGMDTRQVIARFEAERQALAMMDHPNIAKVLDAGNTKSGRPYFVMELVKGEPITTYCDKCSLSVEDRLQLFEQTSRAIQHAHQKGIIHRDIKPSNVMVTLQDGLAVPKVIDFGIAKAIDQPLTQKTLFTEFGQLIGTPEYMSPEQAEMTGLDVDTGSDIYSLGVLLYELLTGTTPFDAKKLRGAAFNEIQRIIREETPDKPSTRLSTLDSLPAIAARRHTEPRRLSLIIRGDLDWIVMKALEKDRSRRYGTASDLATDIQHYLHCEPVTAGPPSAGYRFQKFIRRNKVSVVAAALVAGALVIGLIGTTLGFRRAVALNVNLQAALQRVKDEEAIATRAANRMTMVHEFFLTKMLGANDPDVARGADVTVRQVLVDAAAELEHVADPDLESVLRHEVGAVYFSLGMWKEGSLQLQRALLLRKSDPLCAKSDLADTQLLLARSLQAIGDPARAEQLAREARSIRSELFGADSDEVAEVDFYLAGALYRAGRVKDAGAVNRAALASMAGRHGPGSETPLMARTMVNYASEYLPTLGKDEEAAEMLRNAVAIFRRHEHVESQLAWALSVLGATTSRMTQFEESDLCHAEAMAIRQRLYPNGHLSIAESKTALAVNRMRAYHPEEGEPLAREALEMYIAKLGHDHESVARAMAILGAILASQEKWEQAADVMAETTGIYEHVFTNESARTAGARSMWGGCLIELKEYPEAERLLLDAYGVLDRTGENVAAQRTTVERLVYLYETWGKPESASEWAAKLEPDSPRDN